MEKLYCGRAKRDITPTYENGILPMPVGFSANRRELNDVADELDLRVIALRKKEETILIVSLDIVNLDAAYYGPLLSRHTGIREESLFFMETTAHSTIRAGGDRRNRNNDPEAVEKSHRYRDLILQRMYEACDEALSDMREVTVKIGRGESYVNVNRDYPYLADQNGDNKEFWMTGYHPQGDSDREVIVIMFMEEDNPFAMIVNYGIFNVFMDDNIAGKDGQAAISSDLGGYVSKKLEKHFPDCVAMYTLGANCNNDPLIKARNAVYDPDLGGRRISYLSKEATLELLSYLGDIHYADIVRTTYSLKDVDTDGDLKYLQGEMAVPGRDREAVYPEKDENGFYKIVYRRGEDKHVRFNVLKLGELAFVFQGGSIYSSIGKAMKKESICPDTVLMCGYSNPHYTFEGALVDDEALSRGGHDAERCRYRPGFVRSAAILLMNRLIAALQGDAFHMEIDVRKRDFL